ncbi:FecR family protein [Sinomicrobium soli]|uniref:FecR family protein n=1 Tax=Sinomicrobium sp. N-1-3-6 TaxID=2219864 RepID=UPI000DCB7F4A|nr:FecR domain-containing protein [Sinomicrobium sp. N-1-3-6]RAV30243.1 iron dicitrate transport regulator FecR [Sinomicrobium sp. N-1-3-6]
MQEHDFRKLLDKYLNGTITEEEKRLLDEFEEKLTSEDDSLHFINEAAKSREKKRIWDKVKAGTVSHTASKRGWKVAVAAAAIITGLLSGGYFYFYNSGLFTGKAIPENAITLELEDGSLRIIEENGSLAITGNDGSVIGRQKGKEIVYSGGDGTGDLKYNTLKVPYGKTFELRLSDGTRAYLNAGSSLKYPVRFLKGRDRSVYITGEAFLEVEKDSLHPFIVVTDNVNIRVLGTKFNISAYPEDETSDVVLVEGAVSLYEAGKQYDPSNVVVLKPGFKGSFNKKEKKISREQVTTSLYTSWMEGELIFRNMSFGNIIKKLERHYNVSIVNENKELAVKKFNANFGTQPIEKVLQELKVNYGIDYEIDETDVMIK